MYEDYSSEPLPVASSHLTSDSASTTPPLDHHYLGSSSDSHTSEMSCIEGGGKQRALRLLFTVPERFNDFTHFDQRTFFELADWILANVPSQISTDISVEESLFVFLDIVAQGNSFSTVAYGWDHDVQLTQGIFLNVLHALTVLRESREIAESCPPFKQTRKRWDVTKRWNARRPSRGDGLVRIGYDEMSRDGLEVNQESLKEALMALNNFIHENADHDA